MRLGVLTRNIGGTVNLNDTRLRYKSYDVNKRPASVFAVYTFHIYIFIFPCLIHTPKGSTENVLIFYTLQDIYSNDNNLLETVRLGRLK